VPELAHGVHEVEFKKRGFEIRAFRVMVQENSPPNLDAGIVFLSRRTVTDSLLNVFVKDSETALPVFGAFVSVNGNMLGTTSPEGTITFPSSFLEPGGNEFQVQRMGYISTTQDVVVVSDETPHVVEFEIERIPVMLEDIEVTAEEGYESIRKLEDFFARARFGDGKFLTPEEIEDISASGVTDFLRRIQGVRIIFNGRSNAVRLNNQSLSCRFDEAGGVSGQEPDIYVDGMLANRRGFRSSLAVDQLIQAEMVLAIEVYDSPASVPVQYNRTDNCGVVLIWTKIGTGR